jgi:hypothetical protein
LYQAARKTGAQGTPGVARHPEAETMVDGVAATFRKHGQKTTLRGRDRVRKDFKERPVFIAVQAIMAVCEAKLLERKKAGYRWCGKALIKLQAARGAPYALCDVVRAFNRRVANGQVDTVPPGSIAVDARKPRKPK